MPVAQRNASSSTAYKRFRIRPLHYDGSDTGEYDLFFNSIITEFSDSWTPRWSSNVVFGRNDQLPFYSGTERELTFGFRIVSDDANEAKKNMVKIQQLIKYQYASTDLFGFSNAGQASQPFSIMRAPPYFEFEFLNLFNSFGTNTLRGYINGGVQIQPGFQSKEQAQYFNSDFSQIYFSDVTVTLRITVLHDPDLNFGENAMIGGAAVISQTDIRTYPYGVLSDEAAAINLNVRNADGTPADQTNAGGAPPGAGDAVAKAPGARNNMGPTGKEVIAGFTPAVQKAVEGNNAYEQIVDQSSTTAAVDKALKESPVYEPQSPTFGYKSETEKQREKRMNNVKKHFAKIPQVGDATLGYDQTKKYFFPDIDGASIGDSAKDIGGSTEF